MKQTKRCMCVAFYLTEQYLTLNSPTHGRTFLSGIEKKNSSVEQLQLMDMIKIVLSDRIHIGNNSTKIRFFFFFLFFLLD